jgi:dolichol-phosphate mannosyltransferase
MKACVVVPTFNEKENVPRLVQEVKALGVPGLELLFVDDSSPDGTRAVIEEVSAGEPWVRLMTRERKMGIGSAYRDGFRRALETMDPDALVEMDADLQHPPSTLLGLLRAVEGGADVAIASRYVEGGAVEGWSRWRRMVSGGANAYARFMLRLPVRDCTSGFRAYDRAAAKRIVEAEMPAKGFEFQVATLHLLRKEAKMVEVPYTFSPRRAGKSKLGIRDMLAFFVSVLRMSMG